MSNYRPTRVSAEITARIRGLIARYDVSQELLAKLCNVSQSQFSKIIRGVRPMTIDHFAVICETLNINMSELVSDVEDFLSPRTRNSASPVHLVSEGERTGTHQFLDVDYLDDWALDARERWLGLSNVSRLDEYRNEPVEDDELAAASDRDLDSERNDDDSGFTDA